MDNDIKLSFSNYNETYYVYICEDCLISYNELQPTNIKIDNTEIDISNKYCLYSIYYNGKCILTSRNNIKSKAIIYSDYKDILLCPINMYPSKIDNDNRIFDFKTKYYCTSENIIKIPNCIYHKSNDKCLICENEKKGYQCNIKNNGCELTINNHNDDDNHICLKCKNRLINNGFTCDTKEIKYEGLNNKMMENISKLNHVISNLDEKLHHSKTYEFRNLITYDNKTNKLIYDNKVYTIFNLSSNNKDNSNSFFSNFNDKILYQVTEAVKKYSSDVQDNTEKYLKNTNDNKRLLYKSRKLEVFFL